MQGLKFVHVLKKEFHISLLLYAVKLSTLKVFDNMSDSTKDILLCFFVCWFSLYFFTLCTHLKMHHHDKLERYHFFDNNVSTSFFICMLPVNPIFDMHYTFWYILCGLKTNLRRIMNLMYLIICLSKTESQFLYYVDFE